MNVSHFNTNSLYWRMCVQLLMIGLLTGTLAAAEYSVLAIGVNNYQSTSLVPLNGCVNDADAIARVFGKGGKPLILRDAEATKANIEAAFEQLERVVPDQGKVVLYMSGHGNRLGRDWYFTPHDFDPANPDQSALKGGAISQFVGRLTTRGCLVLLILDACHAGEIARNCEVQLNTLRQPGGGGLVILASSIGSQSSKDGIPNSLFTEQLLKALAAPVDRASGPLEADAIVTLAEVRGILRRELPKRLERLPKSPGLAWEEQVYVTEWSLSVADSLPLIEYESTAGWEPFELHEMRGGLAVGVPNFRHSLVGLWKCAQPVLLQPAQENPDGTTTPDIFLTDVEGQTVERTLALYFDHSGHYLAMELFGSEERSTAGRYEFIPGRRFSLKYENGIDELGLVSLTADELVIQFDSVPGLFNGTRVRPPTEYVFRRVAEQQ